jgi:hypothetical protein
MLMLAVPLAGVYPQQLQICVAVANWFEQKC